MLTLHFHAQSVDRDWVARCNAQDQAEYNALFSPTGLPDAPTADPYRRKMDLWEGFKTKF